MIKSASIDIGSNSVLLLILEKKENNWIELAKESFVTGLGRGLDKTGVFSEESILETYEALKNYKKIIEHYGIKTSSVLCTATEASRVATNSREFFERVKAELGFDIKIITSKAEAFLSAKGILFDNSIKNNVFTVMDIGGASTEFIRVQKNPFKILSTISLPFGAVRATDWLNQGIFEDKKNEIFKRFESDFAKYTDETLYCVAGTMTSVANMLLKRNTFVEDEVNGFSFLPEALFNLLDENKDKNQEAFLANYPFLGKRSRSILGGMYVAQNACLWVKPKNLYVSTYGLRYGVALSGEIDQEFLN